MLSGYLHYITTYVIYRDHYKNKLVVRTFRLDSSMTSFAVWRHSLYEHNTSH